MIANLQQENKDLKDMIFKQQVQSKVAQNGIAAGNESAEQEIDQLKTIISQMQRQQQQEQGQIATLRMKMTEITNKAKQFVIEKKKVWANSIY